MDWLEMASVDVGRAPHDGSHVGGLVVVAEVDEDVSVNKITGRVSNLYAGGP